MTATQARVEIAGQRAYAIDTPFAGKDRLKQLGCKWDPDRRAWWVGRKKADALAALVAELNGTPVESIQAAAQLGFRPETPAGIIADALRDQGRDAEADAIAAAKPAAPKKEHPDQIRLTGKGRYKGREYYAGSITRDGLKVRLLTLPDANGDYLDFWAYCSEVEQTKTYTPREKRDGRRYSNRTVTVYTTLGSIADFVRRQRDPSQARGRCTECDHWGPRGETCEECHEGTHA